jgi:SAM-dependent methyltransferase
MALMSMGLHVQGIDLDVPMLDFSLTRIVEILKTNGAERAAKTAVRGLLFDRSDRASLRRALERRGFNMRIERSGLLVGDAASYDYGDRPFDLIYSQDVFEHVPPSDLEKLIASLPSILAPAGVAFIRPNVYTGIAGGASCRVVCAPG